MNNLQLAQHIANLKDKDKDVRRTATLALGDIGDTAAVPALLGVLRDRDAFVRNCAADALGRIGDASAIAALMEALKDENKGVRCNAANALGRLGDAFAVPALVDALQDEDEYFCKCAVDALGKIGTPAIPALIMALKAEKQFICHMVAGALGAIGDSDTLPRRILADSRCSAQERTDILERVRRVRYNDASIDLHYRFLETPALCRTVVNEEDAAAREGAQSVLNWLNGGRYLLRASQPDTGKQAQELVRPAPGGEYETKPGALLRAAAEPEKEGTLLPLQPTAWQRLFGKRKEDNSL